MDTALVKKLCLAINWRFLVSKMDGKGSSFTVRFVMWCRCHRWTSVFKHWVHARLKLRTWHGEVNVTLTMQNQIAQPKHYVYADWNGVLTSKEALIFRSGNLGLLQSLVASLDSPEWREDPFSVIFTRLDTSGKATVFFTYAFCRFACKNAPYFSPLRDRSSDSWYHLKSRSDSEESYWREHPRKDRQNQTAHTYPPSIFQTSKLSVW